MGLVPTRDADSKTKIIRSENMPEDPFDRHVVKNIVTWPFTANAAIG